MTKDQDLKLNRIAAALAATATDIAAHLSLPPDSIANFAFCGAIAAVLIERDLITSDNRLKSDAGKIAKTLAAKMNRLLADRSILPDIPADIPTGNN